MTVVELVPLAVDRILRVCCVVPATKAAEMIAHCVQVIDALSLRVQNVSAHVETLCRELHHLSDLATAEHTPLMRESFQVHDQIRRRFVNFHFLRCYHVILAFAAVPLIVTLQRFLRTEAAQAVMQIKVLRFSLETGIT